MSPAAIRAWGGGMSDRLTTEEILAAKARAEAATPGPWRAGSNWTDCVLVPHPKRVLLRANEHFEHAADVAFIAAARSDVPRLADDLLAAMAEIERLKASLRDAGDALHRDRSGLATALDKILKEVAGRSWIAESRGCYKWDDDRYKAEAGDALRTVADIAKAALVASGTLVIPAVRAVDKTLGGALEFDHE